MCSTNCQTQDHATFGECMRAKSLRIAYCQSAAGKDATTQGRWDNRLKEYYAACDQGISPRTTRLHDIRAAVEVSNKRGEAFVSEDVH